MSDANSSTAALFGRLAVWSYRNRRLVGVGGLLSSVAAAFIGLPPAVDPDLLHLLPEREPEVRAINELYAQGASPNTVNLTYRSDDPAALDALLDDIVARTTKMEGVDFAVHELEPDVATQLGLLQLAPDEIRMLTDRLRGALALGPAINPFLLQPLMQMGPLTEKIAGVQNQQGFLGGEEGVGRLIIRPTGSSSDPTFTEPFMARLETELQKAEAAAPSVERLWLGGAYRHAAEDVQGIRQDIARTGLASMVAVFATLLVGLRTWRGAVLIFLPLLTANVFVLAGVAMFAGALNSFTSFATAILFGLGIDFGIHLIGRYREERAVGADLEGALRTAWEKVGPPCMTAALTSSGGFMALALAEFDGFAQLGVLLAVGLMACLFAAILFIPALIGWFDQRITAPVGAKWLDTASASSYRLSPAAAVLGVLASVAAGGAVLPNINFEYDISSMRPKGSSYNELPEELQKRVSESYLPVVITYADEATLRADAAKLRAGVEAGELPHLARVASVHDLLPTDQADRVAALNDLARLLEDPNLVYLPRGLVERLAPLKGRELRPWTLADLPEVVRQMLLADDPAHPRLLAFPKGNLWDVREAAAWGAELRGVVGEQPEIAGENLAVAAMYRIAMRDIPLVGSVAALVVALVVWLDFRRVARTLVAMGVLGAGLTWGLAAVHGLGVKLSMINVVGLPILIGIGVDVVVHLIHRLDDEGPGGVRRALATTGLSAWLSTLTTALSFGSLMFAVNRGIQSLGILVGVGLSVVFVVATVFVPVLWSARWRLTGQSPAQRSSTP